MQVITTREQGLDPHATGVWVGQWWEIVGVHLESNWEAWAEVRFCLFPLSERAWLLHVLLVAEGHGGCCPGDVGLD